MDAIITLPELVKKSIISEACNDETNNIDVVMPDLLNYGDLVAIVAPSGSATLDRLEVMLDTLENRFGFRVRVYGQVSDITAKGEAGSPKRRRKALENAFFDPEVKAIFCLKGGAGSMSLLKELDYDLIRQNPTPLIGMSDITCLQSAILVNAGVVTYHGPMWSHFKGQEKCFAIEHLYLMLFEGSREINLDPKDTLRCGEVEGKVICGNLTLIALLAGTPYGYDFSEPYILCLEEIGEDKYAMERMFQSLDMQDAFKNLKGIVIGQNKYNKKDGYQIMFEECVEAYIPEDAVFVSGAKFGHKDHHLTLPVGVKATLSVDNYSSSLKF